MTLIMSLANKEQIILLGDRRISRNRMALDDEYNKMCVLKCREGRFAIGFCGLATSGRYSTNKWLYQSAYDLFPPEYSLEKTFHKLKDKATRDYQQLYDIRNLPKKEKCLSVLIAGYVSSDPPTILNGVLTNYADLPNNRYYYEAQDTFELFSFQQKDNDTEFSDFFMIGNILTIGDSEIELLKQMLKDLKPVDALLYKALEIIREAAKRPVAGNTIGDSLSAVIIPRNSSEPIYLKYFSNTAKAEIHLPLAISTYNDNHHIFVPPGVIANAPGTPVEELFSVPRVAKNQPCPCRSGKRYKSCHGNKKLHTWKITLH